MLKVTLAGFAMLCLFSFFSLLDMYGPKEIPTLELHEMSAALTGSDAIRVDRLAMAEI
jgi:hypothetical protein